ncbi:MAG: hypothetical protein ACKOEO_27505 [Planctomycetaceae bacterium]
MRTLAIRLNSSNQIEVRCGTESRCGECHYLETGFTLNADSTTANEPSHSQLNTAIRQLLREWHRVLSSLEDGGLIWLPFDFSDEITKWLAVQRSGDEATLVFGRAPVEGWAIDPRNLADLPRTIPGFVPDEPLVVEVCPFATLLQDIEAATTIPPSPLPGERGRG